MTAGWEEDNAYHEATRFLIDRINYEKATNQPYTKQYYRLNRMRRLLSELGDPHLRCPVIHIAGTKGKGSTAWLLSETLRLAGYCTGRYTSPHLIHLEERFSVNGSNPTRPEFIAMVDQIRNAVERMNEPGGEPPTFFELTTALAWLYFASKNTDFAVVEVGLGGRLDSTNVCSPVLTVITSISFDHEQQLGNTLALIASEKAGIIKSPVPVVSGVSAPEAADVIADVAKNHSAPLRLIHKDFRYRWKAPSDGGARASFSYEADPRVFRLSRTLTNIPLLVMGGHQAHNAAVVCACTDWLREMGYSILEGATRDAFANTQIPARLEIVSKKPNVIIDSAHNEASVAALIQTLGEYFPAKKKTLVFAVSRDKNYQAILRQLVRSFDSIIVTQFQSNPRAVEHSQLYQATLDAIAEVKPVSVPKVTVHALPDEALRSAIHDSSEQDLIVVAGSFFLAAELLPSFRKN